MSRHDVLLLTSFFAAVIGGVLMSFEGIHHMGEVLLGVGVGCLVRWINE